MTGILATLSWFPGCPELTLPAILYCVPQAHGLGAQAKALPSSYIVALGYFVTVMESRLEHQEQHLMKQRKEAK